MQAITEPTKPACLRMTRGYTSYVINFRLVLRAGIFSSTCAEGPWLRPHPALSSVLDTNEEQCGRLHVGKWAVGRKLAITILRQRDRLPSKSGRQSPNRHAEKNTNTSRILVEKTNLTPAAKPSSVCRCMTAVPWLDLTKHRQMRPSTLSQRRTPFLYPLRGR